MKLSDELRSLKDRVFHHLGSQHAEVLEEIAEAADHAEPVVVSGPDMVPAVVPPGLEMDPTEASKSEETGTPSTSEAPSTTPSSDSSAEVGAKPVEVISTKKVV